MIVIKRIVTIMLLSSVFFLLIFLGSLCCTRTKKPLFEYRTNYVCGISNNCFRDRKDSLKCVVGDKEIFVDNYWWE